MATISSLGVGSGLDIRNLVDDLVAAERAPQENRIDQRQQRAETQLSGLGQVRSALASFQEAVNATANGFNTTTAKSSSEAVSISAGKGASPMSAELEVEALARAQSLSVAASTGGRNEPLGTGTLTFRFGAVETDESGAVSGFTANSGRGAVDITIDPSNNTLEGIRDAVNRADVGIRASIVNDGSGDRLVFASTETGAENGFLVDVTGAEAGSPLEAFAFNEDSTAAELNRAARDAVLRVDGLRVTRPTNTIDDVLEGATLTLNEVSSNPVQVSIEEDSAAARETIEVFVEAFNALQAELNRLTRFDPETGEAGPLNGNALVRNLTSSLRNQLTAPLEALQGRSVRSTADVGILTRRDGTLELDSDRLERALAADPEAVQALFTRTGIVEGSGFEFANARQSAAPGQYRVEVTEPATRGAASLEMPDFPLTIADGSSFRVTVNGVQSAKITLTPGEYTSADDFFRELESRINGDSHLRQAGARVQVSDQDGQLRIRSTEYGSESGVSFGSVSAALAGVLDLAGAQTTKGTDTQGTIGGRPAVGEGLRLTSNEGPATGVGVNVEPGVTGRLGTLSFSTGVSRGLNGLLDNYLRNDGLLNNITRELDSTLERLASDRDRLDRRMERVEARYIREFSAMDAMVAQMNETSNFLQQQLDGLNNNRR